jgi:hypothetical protein
MKTFSAKANEVLRKWWIIDAKDQILGGGRIIQKNIFRGKEKAVYTTKLRPRGECPGPPGAASGIARRARDPRDNPA